MARRNAAATKPAATTEQQATGGTLDQTGAEKATNSVKQQPQAGTADGQTSAPATIVTAPDNAPKLQPEPSATLDQPAQTEPVTPATGEIEGIFVRATVARRCRAGLCFDQDGTGFAKGVLSAAQIEAFEADPLLKVEHGTFTDAPEAEA